MNKKNIIITLLLTSTILSFSMNGWARDSGVGKTESEEIEEELKSAENIQEITEIDVDGITRSNEEIHAVIKKAIKDGDLKLFRYNYGHQEKHVLYESNDRRYTGVEYSLNNKAHGMTSGQALTSVTSASRDSQPFAQVQAQAVDGAASSSYTAPSIASYASSTASIPQVTTSVVAVSGVSVQAGSAEVSVVAAGSSQAPASGSFVGGGSALVALTDTDDVVNAINQNARSQEQAEVLMSLIRGGYTVVQKDAQFYVHNNQGQAYTVTTKGTLSADSGVALSPSATLGSPASNLSNQLVIQGANPAQLIAPNPPSSSSLSAGDAESSQPLAQVQVQAGTDAVSSSVKSSAVYPITTSSIATAAPVSEAASVTPASPQISQVTSASGAAVQMGEAVVVVHDDPGVSKAGLPRLMSKDELEKIENIEIANRIKDQMSNEPALQAWDFGNGRIVLRNAKSGSSYEVQSKASSHTQGNQVGRFTVSEAHPSTTTPAVQPKAKNKLESTMQEKTKIIQSGRASLSQSGVSKPKKKSEEN